MSELKTNIEYPDRLIPSISNHVLLALIQNTNIGIEAKVGPNGTEYLRFVFWEEGCDESIILEWGS